MYTHRCHFAFGCAWAYLGAADIIRCPMVWVILCACTSTQHPSPTTTHSHLSLQPPLCAVGWGLGGSVTLWTNPSPRSWAAFGRHCCKLLPATCTPTHSLSLLRLYLIGCISAALRYHHPHTPAPPVPTGHHTRTWVNAARCTFLPALLRSPPCPSATLCRCIVHQRASERFTLVHFVRVAVGGHSAGADGTCAG